MTKNIFNIQMRFRGGSVLLATYLGASAMLGGPAYASGLPSAADAHGAVYVAMGDSYASGAGIEPMVSSRLCGRSAVNYAHLVARDLGTAEFRDVTCAGAKVADFGAPRIGENDETEAPQYDALSADTTLVTVGIGGNDIGLVGLAISCFRAVYRLGDSCAAQNKSNRGDVYADKIAEFAGAYGEMVEEIRRRAPRAEVVMVGYPTFFRTGGCPLVQPMWPADANYLQARIEQLNAVMKEQAAAHDARFVDLIESTRGHDACASPDQRWLEGPVPVDPSAAPLHPNSAGYVNMANEVLATVQRSN
ncbi:SGNH/GDSL hydrolase family protein [Nocardia sp. NPDC050713]|uniref:SGNH/GDSL hydrolase family protein n=1 Tax=Nocardia sp. NPDC050713 TaxID=3154511 RepID=UPI003403E1F2